VIFETPGGTVHQSLPLQQEIFYTNQPPGSVLYDDYDDYSAGPQASYRPADGVYHGEIQLDSMSRGRSRPSYGEQETRFM